ncbi:hypothetical protein Q1695_003843 [Nippostrongylus brasiliensis]|nr:hypothetical protein Q1695_003843 [Nippostrongylus brasiliensis]
MAASLPDPNGAVNETWQQAARTILQCAKETVGETLGGPKGKKATWFWNDEVQKVVREKKRAYKTWQKSRSSEDLTIYKKYKRLAKAAVAKAKNAEMDGLYEKLEEPQAEKFAFRLAKARHRASLDVRVVKTMKNDEGCSLRRPADVKSRWEEYFKGLLNEEFPREHLSEAAPVEGPVQLWSEEEVQTVIRKMKVGKAVGPDGVPVEAWKALGEYGIGWLTRFLNKVTAEGKMPESWRDSIIVPIFKQKGDATECSNYIGIKLISHTMQVYERLIDSRLRDMVEIAQQQLGFMPGRSTTDAIFIARQVMEKYREKRRPIYLAFLDLEKAYDRLPRTLLWWSLRQRNVPKRLVQMIKLLNNKIKLFNAALPQTIRVTR